MSLVVAGSQNCHQPVSATTTDAAARCKRAPSMAAAHGASTLTGTLMTIKNPGDQ
ncbi:hypothetical protein D3C72_2575860 [compost metagenome]